MLMQGLVLPNSRPCAASYVFLILAEATGHSQYISKYKVLPISGGTQGGVACLN